MATSKISKFLIVTPVFVAFMACLSFAIPAHGQVLLMEDFQDGNADGWAADPREGDIRLSSYQGNHSLQLTRNAYALRKISVGAAERLDIRASFAADGLEGDDECRFDVSLGGKEWTNVGRITDGQDDGITLHTVQTSMIVPDDKAELFLGLRIEGNADNDRCWADNISVTALRDIENLVNTVPSETLWNDNAFQTPVLMTAFAQPDNPLAPKVGFSGSLEFNGEEADHFELLKDDFQYAAATDSYKRLPAFNLEWVQSGTDFIPVQRGPIANGHPDWEWVFEPGKIWADPNNNDTARVSVPFALQERNANCLHNGVMMFELSGKGKSSDIMYQVASETCAYMQFNLWGKAATTFERGLKADSSDVIKAHEEELSGRLPSRSISELPLSDQFGSPFDVDPATMTAFGYVMDGQHYTGACETRFGPYPYCNGMDLPSYSWAKSIVGGLASMRLERLYPGAMNSLISDYVSACEGWKDVRFIDALNMATGRYTSAEYDVDEAAAREFFLANTHKEKIEYACKTHKRQSAPGESFVYHTTDTYILGTAITAYLRANTEDPKADVFDTLLLPLFKDIGLSPTAQQTRRTYDDERQAFTGWGLTWLRSDVALLAQFIQSGGVLGGEAKLDADMLSAALQQSPHDRGLRAVIDSQRYRNGFWAWNAADALGCKDDVWIPAMSGYGGLSAAFMPNGHTYYYISDGNDFKWSTAATASNALKPFCTPKPNPKSN